MTYYLFRTLQNAPLVMECSKWDDGKHPTDVHIVHVDSSSCSCVAMKRECRHVQCCRDLQDGFLDEVEQWMWTAENGWTETHDIPTRKEFLSAIAA